MIFGRDCVLGRFFFRGSSVCTINEIGHLVEKPASTSGGQVSIILDIVCGRHIWLDGGNTGRLFNEQKFEQFSDLLFSKCLGPNEVVRSGSDVLG
jgi:hypothetical protein